MKDNDLGLGIYCTGHVFAISGGGQIVANNLLQVPGWGEVTLFVSSYAELPNKIEQNFRVVRLRTPRSRLGLEVYDQLIGPWVLWRHRVKRVLCLDSILPLLFFGDSYLFYQMRMFHFEQFDTLSKKFKNLLGKLSMRRAKRVFVASQDHASDIVERAKINPEKVVVAHLGFSLPAELTTWQRPREGPYMVFISVRRPYKNLLGLIKAYRIAKEKDAGIVPPLLVIGGAAGKYKGGEKYESELRNTIEEFGLKDHVEFLGALSHDEVLRFLYSADMFVFPTLFEGFGLPLLEAMSLGVPVCASNVHSLPEIGGDTVRYFDPRSESEMADIMLDCLASGRGEEVVRAKERAKSFTWDRTAKIVRKHCMRRTK